MDPLIQPIGGQRARNYLAYPFPCNHRRLCDNTVTCLWLISINY